MVNKDRLLADHWRIRDKRITKYGPVWKIETRERCFCLKRCKHGLAHLIFAHHIMEGLREEGFSQVTHLIPTVGQLPYVETADGPFVLMEWVGRPLEKKSEHEWILAAQQLARFHRASAQVQLPAEIKKYYFSGKWLQRMPERIEAMNEKISRFSRPANRFEEEVKADAAVILDAAEVAQIILQRSRYGQMVQEIYQRPALCHGNVKAKNFTVREDGTIFIIDFDSFRFDLPIQDVSNLFFEALSSLNWSFSFAQQLFHAYDQERPVHPEEIPILEALLFFPEDLYKIIKKYRKKTGPEVLLKKWQKEFPKFLEQGEFYGRWFSWLNRELRKFILDPRGQEIDLGMMRI